LPTNVILNNLLGPTLTGKFLELYENDKDLIEDLILSNGQLIDLCQANLKNIVNIREAYSTIVANNLNRTMKFLTSITVILTVPMIVGSLWGMNIPLPLANYSGAFPIMTLGVLAVSIILLIIFSKKKWL
jgi:magnesium transporter